MKCTVLRQVRRHITHDCALYRADVGDDGTGRQMRTISSGHRAAFANRNGDDDEVGAFDCGSV